MRKDCLFFSLIFAAFAVSVQAQKPTAQLAIRSAVPPAGYLGSAGGSTSVEPLDVPSLGNRALNVKVRQSEGGVVIPLLARSNASYSVVAKLASNADDSVYLRADSVSPAAGGMRLAPGATQARLFEGAVSSGSSGLKIAEGSRISRSGNNSNADNAILIHVHAQLPEHLPEAVLLFEMVLAGN